MPGRRSFYGPEKARRLMETELEVEYKLSIKHRKGFEIFRAAKAAELRIVLASDMYLPKKFIGKLLAKHGIAGYSDLFVSSDSRCMKSDGTLFDLIHRKLGIEPQQMIHIRGQLAVGLSSAAENAGQDLLDAETQAPAGPSTTGSACRGSSPASKSPAASRRTSATTSLARSSSDFPTGSGDGSKRMESSTCFSWPGTGS